ncbi:hypothetical protein CH063_10404 [Colletotrichum higginsianum]|uniref:Uncharacterized protein n=1 Tax=Colletotrichum higginsianum (strain IMI 349063) TaxID=759273 RepID=H1VHC1_COLHI|nr:hypothetical protein CH063_10404 [Colletotrichum higginsianum]
MFPTRGRAVLSVLLTRPSRLRQLPVRPRSSWTSSQPTTGFSSSSKYRRFSTVVGTPISI